MVSPRYCPMLILIYALRRLASVSDFGKTVYTSCHVSLTTPFILYHFNSILWMSYHLLLFQMNGIKHVGRLSPHVAGDLSPHSHCRSMSLSHTLDMCWLALNLLMLPLSQYPEGFLVWLQWLLLYKLCYVWCTLVDFIVIH